MKNISLSEIDGFSVGHAEDLKACTGCTAVLTPLGAVASGYTPGFAPGNREMDVLKPHSAPQKIHGLLLAGGSAFGLSAAHGVMRYLMENNYGLDTGVMKVPLVPAAVIFDYPYNLSGGNLPDEHMGYRAAEAANKKPLLNGAYGAGISARSGKLGGNDFSSPSGLGSFGVMDNGLAIAALVVVNPLGSIINPDNGAIVSGLRNSEGGLANRQQNLAALKSMMENIMCQNHGHTVLAVIGTNARLTKMQAYQVSRMAAAGLHRSVFPSGLLFDGDTIFTLSSNSGPQMDESWLGAMAADVLARAIYNSALAAKSGFYDI